MSVFGSAHNRFLRQYGGKIARDADAEFEESLLASGDPRYVNEFGMLNPTTASAVRMGKRPLSEQEQAFTKATQVADQNARRALVEAPHAAAAGGDLWNSFEQFHNVRGDMERSMGNRYGVGSISGGGDLNERPLSSLGNTRTVSAARRTGGGGGGEMDMGGLNFFDEQRLQKARLESALDALWQGGKQERLNTRALELGVEGDELSLEGDREKLARFMEQPEAGSQRYYDRLTGEATHKNAMADESERSAARMFFDPTVTRKRNAEQGAAIERSTAAARAQGELSLDRAGIEADARIKAAEATAAGRRQTDSQILQNWIKAINDAAAKGMFGRDRRGNPNPIPEELSGLATKVLSESMTGGAVPTWVPKGMEAGYQQARAEGYTDAQIQQFFSGR